MPKQFLSLLYVDKLARVLATQVKNLQKVQKEGGPGRPKRDFTNFLFLIITCFFQAVKVKYSKDMEILQKLLLSFLMAENLQLDTRTALCEFLTYELVKLFIIYLCSKTKQPYVPSIQGKYHQNSERILINQHLDRKSV